MTNIQQLQQALFHAPLSLRLLGKKSAQWLLVYLLAGIFLFSVFIWQLIDNQELIKSAIFDYFFPQSWQGISEQLTEFLYNSQTKTVIANAIISGSLVFAAMFLFPLKEQFSAVFEKESGLSDGSEKEFPLWLQGWEEVKLLLFYLASQGVILWIGYYPYFWTTWISIFLSYLFLFFTFGLDFIAPTLQRHRKSYTLILKTVFKHPVIVVAFGALFSLPVIGISQIVFLFDDLTLIEMTGILFISNILFLTLAVPAGTTIAVSIMPIINQTKMPSPKAKIIGYSTILTTLAAMIFLHGGLIASLHHKSQLLKANYDIDFSSFNFDLPSLDNFLNGKALTNASFNLSIENPTQFDILVEQSQLWIEKEDKVIATIDISGFNVPAGEKRDIELKLDSNSNLGKITNFRTLLESWRVDLHIELWPGIPFIVNLSGNQ